MSEPVVVIAIVTTAIVVLLSLTVRRHPFKGMGVAFKALALAKRAKALHERGIELEAAIADLGNLYEKAKELDELRTFLEAA